MKKLTLLLAGILAVSIGLTAGMTEAAAAAQQAACSTYILKAKADSIALAAIGGGTVLSAVLEKGDNPVDWSVNLKNKSGKEYEVKVNACTGAVIAIIVGG